MVAGGGWGGNGEIESIPRNSWSSSQSPKDVAQGRATGEQGIVKNKVIPEELEVGNAGMLPAAIRGWPSPTLSWANTQENITETSGSTGITMERWGRVTAPGVLGAHELPEQGVHVGKALGKSSAEALKQMKSAVLNWGVTEKIPPLSWDYARNTN